MKKFSLFIVALLSLQLAHAATITDEVAEQYVQLVLALGQHDSGYVDAYYGPAEWQAAAQQRKMELTKIVIVARTLQDVLANETAADEIGNLRLAFLNTQLTAVSAKALMIIGNVKFDFDQQSQMLYDTQPPKYGLSTFKAKAAELDKLLPGEGSVVERMDVFKQQFVIPTDKLKIVFDAAIKECRNRTKAFINLMLDENFTLEFVTDKPWGGYNWYQGKSFSLIQVNTELPIDISRAIDLGCHEGYPGHHTYNSLLEEALYKKRGWVEYSVYPLYSPQSLIAEGSANYGIEMAFPGDEKLMFEKQVLFPLAGIDPALAKPYAQVAKITQQLNYAGNEVARLLVNGKIDDAIALKMLQEYSLMSAAKARQRVKFIHTYGAYVINYNWGKDLVKQWVEQGAQQTPADRWKRFAQLLSSPRLPSTLN